MMGIVNTAFSWFIGRDARAVSFADSRLRADAESLSCIDRDAGGESESGDAMAEHELRDVV